MAQTIMKRSGGITASAVVVFLGSAVCLVCGVLYIAMSGSLADGQMDARVMRMGATIMGIFLLGFAAWGIASAVGLLGLRGWARISVLVFSMFLTLVFGLAALSMLFVPLPQRPEDSPAFVLGLRAGAALFMLLPAALGAFWIYFFCKDSVRRQFAGDSSEPLDASLPAKPASIIVIAWFLATGGAATAFLIPLHFPVMLFGRAFSGRLATSVYVATGIMSFALGWGMLRWKPWARTAASWYFLFWFVHGAAQMLLPGSAGRLAAMQNLMPRWFPNQPTPSLAFPEWFAVLVGVLLNLVTAYFLVSRKDAYLAVSATHEQADSSSSAAAGSSE